MLRSDWSPRELSDFEQRWEHVRLSADGIVLASEAGKLEVAFCRMAEELGDLVAQAMFYTEQMKFRLKSARTNAYLLSSGKTDKAKENDANNDPAVRLAETMYIEALAYQKLLDNRYDSAVRSHYALKALIPGAKEREWLAV